MNNIGAAWIKKSKKGETYLSCQIEIDGKKIHFACFKNNHKKEDKHPDYQFVLSEKKESVSNQVQNTFGNDDNPFNI
jgi:uncharacterized protein (DUF736 family)